MQKCRFELPSLSSCTWLNHARHKDHLVKLYAWKDWAFKHCSVEEESLRIDNPSMRSSHLQVLCLWIHSLVLVHIFSKCFLILKVLRILPSALTCIFMSGSSLEGDNLLSFSLRYRLTSWISLLRRGLLMLAANANLLLCYQFVLQGFAISWFSLTSIIYSYFRRTKPLILYWSFSSSAS